MSRQYTVCTSKTCDSWIWTDRIAKLPHPCCAKCGKAWRQPKNTPQPASRETETPQRVWRNAQPGPVRKPRFAQKGTVAKALHTLWEKMSPDVQEALRQAGFQHQEKDAVEPPPGLAKGPKGFPCDVELWQSATPQQKLLLEQMGIGEPPAERPDLKTLIKTHMDQLPEALRKAVVDLDPPEPEPSATRQVEETTKRFKLATTELRLLIQKSAGLQVRIDKAKSLYGELLDQMKQLQADLKEKQDSVALLQKELEQKVQKDFDSPKLPCAFEVLLALRTAGIQLSPEQEAKLTGQALEDMEVDQNNQQAPVGAGQALQSEQPVDDKAFQKDRPAGPQTDKNKARSRSRGRASQQGPVVTPPGVEGPGQVQG